MWARRAWHNRRVGKEYIGTANMGKDVSTADMWSRRVWTEQTWWLKDNS